MATTIADIDRRIRLLRKELEELETAARVLRRLDGAEQQTEAPANFAELTMPEAAKQILLEIAPQAMHYKEIARLAIERGFKGKRIDPESSAETIAASFRRMMGQDREVFQGVGEGHYRITEDFLRIAG